MKRFFILAVALSVALMPVAASAATLTSGQQYSLPPQQQVSDDLYVAAGTATIGGNVVGDVFVVGGTISVTGAVSGDIVALGGTVQILGPVDGDVRVGGGSVSVNGNVDGDLMVAGGTVHLLPSATIHGDLITAGGQITIDGIVQDDIRMVGGVLAINGTVGGDVHARADKPVQLGESSIIGGTVSYTPSAKTGGKVHVGFPKGIFWAALGIVTGMKLLAFLGLGILLLWVWRRQTLDLLAQAHGAFWPSIGRGFAYAILVPIAAILLLISFIGSLAGVIILLAYAAVWILASVMAGMLLGAWIAKLFAKRSTLRLGWWSGLGGIILLSILGVIPVIGWLLAKILALLMFGVLAHAIQKQFSSR